MQAVRPRHSHTPASESMETPCFQWRSDDGIDVWTSCSRPVCMAGIQGVVTTYGRPGMAEVPKSRSIREARIACDERGSVTAVVSSVCVCVCVCVCVYRVNVDEASLAWRSACTVRAHSEPNRRKRLKSRRHPQQAT
jgi:hypothetical protein